MVQRKIRIVQHKVSPIGYVVVTDFLLPFGAFHYGEYEVYVRMYQLIPFYTRGTRTACVSLRTVRATDITGVSQSKRKFSSSCRAAEKLCMRDTSFLHFLYQSLFGCFLADYIFKNTTVIFKLINLSGYFLNAVYRTYGIEMNTGNMVFH